MMDDRRTQEPTAESPSNTSHPRTLRATWKKILAGFVLVDMIGVWILMVRIIQLTSPRARWFRMSIFVGSIVLTIIGIAVERYLLPGIIARVGKKLALFLVVFLVALYVFYPAIEYFRGDDDIYLATMMLSDGRKLQDAQRVASGLRILSVHQNTLRVVLSKRDYTRLRRRGYTVALLQNPAQRYRVEQMNARPPGVPNRRVEQMIHAIVSDSLMYQIRMLERFGSRVDHSVQADSAADYIAKTLKQYGLEVESIPFDSPASRYAFADAVASRFVSRNICGTLKGTGASNAECIIVAHYDSVNPTVPGANDNASGVAAVLEAARICSRFSFTHTIRFLAVGAEEIGLVGSYQYAGAAKAQGRNIISVVNGDMLGYPIIGDPRRLIVVGGTQWSALMDSALVYNRRYHLNFLVDAHTSQYGGSDHESFIKAGYAAVEISEGTATEIWSGLDPYYHTPFDTSDKMSADLLRHCAQLMMTVTAEMAGPVAFSPSGR